MGLGRARRYLRRWQKGEHRLYLLLSPALFGKVKAGGVDRKGLWHGPRTQNPWEMLPTLTEEQEAASDHAAIWVELDL
jgi:hypothetical protein